MNIIYDHTIHQMGARGGRVPQAGWGVFGKYHSIAHANMGDPGNALNMEFRTYKMYATYSTIASRRILYHGLIRGAVRRSDQVC